MGKRSCLQPIWFPHPPTACEKALTSLLRHRRCFCDSCRTGFQQSQLGTRRYHPVITRAWLLVVGELFLVLLLLTAGFYKGSRRQARAGLQFGLTFSCARSSSYNMHCWYCTCFRRVESALYKPWPRWHPGKVRSSSCLCCALGASLCLALPVPRTLLKSELEHG